MRSRVGQPPALSLDRVAAFRYYRRQFFKPRHTALAVRHFRLTGPYRASGEKKDYAGLCASTQLQCFTTANRVATYFRRRSRHRKTCRRGRVKLKKKKKKKEKEKIAFPTLRQEKMRMSGGDGRIFAVSERSRKSMQHLAALLCLASTLYLTNGNLRVRVTKRFGNRSCRSDNITVLSVHLVYICRSLTQNRLIFFSRLDHSSNLAYSVLKIPLTCHILTKF